MSRSRKGNRPQPTPVSKRQESMSAPERSRTAAAWVLSAALVALVAGIAAVWVVVRLATDVL